MRRESGSRRRQSDSSWRGRSNGGCRHTASCSPASRRAGRWRSDVAGLRYPEALAGIMCLSGYLLLPDTLTAEAAPASRAVPIFLAHGAEDPVVPHALGRGSCETLRPAASPTLSGTLRHETVRLRALGGCGRPAPRPGRHRPARGAVRRATASRAVARRRWTAPVPTRGRPVVRRTPDGGDRLGATHRVDLRRAKGPPASRWSTFT